MELCYGEHTGSGGNCARIGDEIASFSAEIHFDWELKLTPTRIKKGGITGWIKAISCF